MVPNSYLLPIVVFARPQKSTLAATAALHLYFMFSSDASDTQNMLETKKRNTIVIGLRCEK